MTADLAGVSEEAWRDLGRGLLYAPERDTAQERFLAAFHQGAEAFVAHLRETLGFSLRAVPRPEGQQRDFAWPDPQRPPTYGEIVNHQHPAGGDAACSLLLFRHWREVRASHARRSLYWGLQILKYIEAGVFPMDCLYRPQDEVAGTDRRVRQILRRLCHPGPRGGRVMVTGDGCFLSYAYWHHRIVDMIVHAAAREDIRLDEERVIPHVRHVRSASLERVFSRATKTAYYADPRLLAGLILSLEGQGGDPALSLDDLLAKIGPQVNVLDFDLMPIAEIQRRGAALLAAQPGSG